MTVLDLLERAMDRDFWHNESGSLMYRHTCGMGYSAPAQLHVQKIYAQNHAMLRAAHRLRAGQPLPEDWLRRCAAVLLEEVPEPKAA